MPFEAFTPPPSNTQPTTPQIEAQGPRGPHRGGISTFLFILILGVLACVVYAVTMHQSDVIKHDAVEETARAAQLQADRPSTIVQAEALALAHNVAVYKFTGTNNDGYFTVDPGKAWCDSTFYESQDDDEYGVIACGIDVDPTTNPLNESQVDLNITVDWTNGNTPVRCDFYLGETHIAKVDCD